MNFNPVIKIFFDVSAILDLVRVCIWVSGFFWEWGNNRIDLVTRVSQFCFIVCCKLGPEKQSYKKTHQEYSTQNILLSNVYIPDVFVLFPGLYTFSLSVRTDVS